MKRKKRKNVRMRAKLFQLKTVQPCVFNETASIYMLAVFFYVYYISIGDTMIDVNSKTIVKLKEQYNKIYPLIVHRSLERAKSPGDSFDILDRLWKDIQESMTVEDGEEVCNAFPIVWDDEQHQWVKTDDLFQSQAFIAKQKERK